jgi:ElaA protein
MYQWTLKAFNDLTLSELYALLRLRSEVFVVEQHCVFQDMDGADAGCHHLLGWTTGPDGEPLLGAYVRIVPPGLKFPEPSIGRVATSPLVRGTGAGRALMGRAVSYLYDLFGRQPIRIGAQQYLLDFYGSFGFVQTGEMYLEDDIPHVEMVKN